MAPDQLEAFARRMREIVLEQSKRANVGHIGSCLSVVDILTALYAGGMDVAHPGHPDRDRFVMSKGHAALALYAAIHLRGFIPASLLKTFCADDSLLGVHPEVALTGVDFSTGSLGQGLSMGAGAALGARLAGSGRRAFVLLSDAECNEGAVWEAAMFAAHHRLANLVAIVDLNGQQALGYTADVLRMSPMGDRWAAFGWDVWEVDGHDAPSMQKVLAEIAGTPGDAPHVLVASTVFGHGVSFMERRIEWHYLPMSPEQYAQALADIGSR
jgi:transketolase